MLLRLVPGQFKQVTGGLGGANDGVASSAEAARAVVDVLQSGQRAASDLFTFHLFTVRRLCIGLMDKFNTRATVGAVRACDLWPTRHPCNFMMTVFESLVIKSIDVRAAAAAAASPAHTA